MLHCDNEVFDIKLNGGDNIYIKTKMGHFITEGKINSIVPSGLLVSDFDGRIKFYSNKLYLFESESNFSGENLSSMSLDDRVKYKLANMSEEGDTPSKTGARPVDDKEDEEGTDKKKEKDTKPVADTDSSIDTDKLPDDIKKAVISSDEMDESQLNSVLSDISDASIKSLKRVGISETRIFDIVKRINDAALNILTSDNKR